MSAPNGPALDRNEFGGVQAGRIRGDPGRGWRAVLRLVALLICGACRKEAGPAAQVTVTVANERVASGLEGTWLQEGQVAWIISRKSSVLTIAVLGSDKLAKDWHMRLQNARATADGVELEAVAEAHSQPHPFSGLMTRFVLTPRSDGSLHQRSTTTGLGEATPVSLRRR